VSRTTWLCQPGHVASVVDPLLWMVPLAFPTGLTSLGETVTRRSNLVITKNDEVEPLVAGSRPRDNQGFGHGLTGAGWRSGRTALWMDRARTAPRLGFTGSVVPGAGADR
jgi:hypothetical protein